MYHVTCFLLQTFKNLVSQILRKILVLKIRKTQNIKSVSAKFLRMRYIICEKIKRVCCQDRNVSVIALYYAIKSICDQNKGGLCGEIKLLNLPNLTLYPFLMVLPFYARFYSAIQIRDIISCRNKIMQICFCLSSKICLCRNVSLFLQMSDM